jgi:iron(III) transport system permease protein
LTFPTDIAANGTPPAILGWRRILAAGRNAGSIGFISAAILLLLAALVVPPLVILIYGSFTTQTAGVNDAAFTLGNYAQILESTRLLSGFSNSLIVASFATILPLVVGGSMAWLVERTNAPFKTLAYITSVVSLGTPYIVYAVSWIFLLGRVGPANDLYRMLTGSQDVLFNINTIGGMILVQGFIWCPVVFLLLAAAFRNANAEMEEAARISGASIFETIYHISLKLALPAVMATALLVFIGNLEAFDVPALIGMPGRINVLTTDIYESIKQQPPSLGRACAFSLAMVIIVGTLFSFYNRVARYADRYASITGKGYRPRVFDLGRGRWLGGSLILTSFVMLIVLPMLALLWSALSPFPRPFRFAAFSSLTLQNFSNVVGSGDMLSLGINTVLVSAGAATASMVITVFAGWLSARRRAGGALINQLAMVPLVLPGIVFGVAMMQIGLRFPIPIYGTLWLIFAAFAIRYLPLGMRYSFSGVLQIHRELEEAAAVSGASPLKTLRRVVAPLLTPAIISGWLFIFLVASKELAIAVLLAGPRSQTIAVTMLDQWVNGQAGELSALGLFWTAVMTIFAIAFYFTTQRRPGAAQNS